MKRLPKHQAILLVFFAMALICDLAIFNSVAFKGSDLPIFSIKLSRANEGVAGSNANIDRKTISREVKCVIDESLKSRTQNPIEKQIILQAKKDLSQRLSIKIDKVNLLEIREVTWPDSSLGCPEPGKAYNQVSRSGFLIRLEAKGRMYFYHSAGTLNPFLCEKTSRIIPHPSKIDEFIPPPGSEID